MEAQLSDLGVSELSEVLRFLRLNKFRKIVEENECNGAVLNELTSEKELLKLFPGTNVIEAGGWLKEISKLKEKLPNWRRSHIGLECPVCFRSYCEVDPTTLSCGHSLCIADANRLKFCPECTCPICENSVHSISYTIRSLAVCSGSGSGGYIGHEHSKQNGNANQNVDDFGMLLNALGNLFLAVIQVVTLLIVFIWRIVVTVCSMMSKTVPVTTEPDAVVPEDEQISSSIMDKDVSVKSETEHSFSTLEVNTKKLSRKRKVYDELLNLFERANYYGCEESFDQLLSMAKDENIYAIGLLELCHCGIYFNSSIGFMRFNMHIDGELARKSMEALRTTAKAKNNKVALFIIAAYNQALYLNPQVYEFRAESHLWSVWVSEEMIFEYFQKSYELGCSFALCGMAICYNHGIGVVQDNKIGDEFYSKAISLGHHVAKFFKIYSCNPEFEKEMKQCTKDGVLLAQHLLGEYLLSNDRKFEAVLSLNSSVNRGCSFSMYTLAVQSSDEERKIKLFKDSAMRGNTTSASSVILHYASDPLNPVISHESIYFYQLGIRMNLAIGMCAWAAVCRSRNEFDEAFSYFLKASDMRNANDEYVGCPYAYFALGEMYEIGQGTKPNFKKALELYGLAWEKEGHWASESFEKIKATRRDKTRTCRK